MANKENANTKSKKQRIVTRGRIKNIAIVANTKQIIENIALEKQFLAIGF